MTTDSELPYAEKARRAYQAFLFVVLLTALMDILSVGFLILSAIIARWFYPDVPLAWIRSWRVAGISMLLFGLASKPFAKRAVLILPPRDEPTFLTKIRGQARRSYLFTLWNEWRIFGRNLLLALIALLFALEHAANYAFDWAAFILFLIAACAAILTLRTRYRTIPPFPPNNELGAMRYLISQTEFQIGIFRKKISLLYLPSFLIGSILLGSQLGRRLPFSHGAFDAALPSNQFAVVLPFIVLVILLLPLVILARKLGVGKWQSRLEELKSLLAEMTEARSPRPDG